MNVKYFGMIAEWVGTNQNEIKLSGTSVNDLKKQLESQYEKLNGISYHVAVDQNIGTEDQELTENNEIALLPPFAGG